MKKAPNGQFLLGAFALSLAALFTPCRSTAAQTAAELGGLQGYWQGEGPGGKCSITITGNSLHYSPPTGHSFTATFTLPTGTDPQQLRATIIQDNPPPQNSTTNKVVVAVFKIEDGTLTVSAFEDPAKALPKSFEDKQRQFYVLRKQVSQYIRCMIQDKTGNLWFGTEYGVCRYDGTSLTYFRMKEGFTDKQVNRILQDESGNLWFATGGGVSRYDGKSFTNFTVKDGLSDNTIWGMLKDSKGNFWFGTTAGVSRYDGNTFTRFPIPRADVEYNSRFNPDVVWSIIEDKKGNIWFGMDGGGARKYDGKSLTTYTKKDGLGGNNISCILEDKTGRLWFADGGGGLVRRAGGLSRYDGKSFTTFTEKDGLRSNAVHTLFEDKSGNLWFATGGRGVCRYDGKSFVTFSEEEGLDWPLVQSILEDRAGRLWVGCSGGVYRFDGTKFVNFTGN